MGTPVPESGGADLTVSSGDLTPVRDAARELYDDLEAHGHGPEAETEQSGQELRRIGASTGEVLTRLAEDWRQQCNKLTQDCGRISGHLDQAVSAFLGQDQEARAALAGIQPTQSILDLAGVTRTPADDTVPYRSPIWDLVDFHDGPPGLPAERGGPDEAAT